MIVVHVTRNTEDADVLKQHIKQNKLGKQVKLEFYDEDVPTTLVGASGQYAGMQKVVSYLRGYFR